MLHTEYALFYYICYKTQCILLGFYVMDQHKVLHVKQEDVNALIS